MSNNISYVDLAYQVLVEFYDSHKDANGGKSVPMKFLDLLKEVGERLGYETEEQFIELASKFYTALTLDGRFVAKENNTWVLREHEKYEDVHIDMNKIYTLDEEDEDAEETDGSEDKENDSDEANEEDEESKDFSDEGEESEDDIPVTSGDVDDDENE